MLAELRHDLRTPLNAIIGYSEILLEDAEADGQSASLPELSQIHAAGRELLELVNRILDPARVKAGELDMDLSTLGTALHLVNLARPRPVYRVDRSRRRNRHVFDRGATLRRGFTFTLGNVVSNASTGEGTPVDRQRLLDRHEGLHIWQSRAFGPLYQAVYLAWFVLGLAAGLSTWVVRRGKPGLFRLVETAAYYDNPFEFWAYKRDDHWEDNRADPVLKWRRPRWLKRKPAPSSSPPTAPPAA